MDHMRNDFFPKHAEIPKIALLNEQNTAQTVGRDDSILFVDF